MHSASLVFLFAIVFIMHTQLAVQRATSQDDAEKAQPFEPTSQFEKQEIEGWSVMINKRLLGDKRELGVKAIRLLQLQLYQLKLLLPADKVTQLQQVQIWLDDDPRNQIHYHPERGWLVENNFNPDRAQAVDIGRADRFVNVYREQPFVVLHELAHAYHHQFVGFEDERVKAVFEKAQKSGDYNSVLKIQEHSGKHYALSNHKEFFAETTESFFGTNDFYPFVRSELKEHDLAAYQLMREIWLGETPAPVDESKE
jgi:hypothetical protein